MEALLPQVYEAERRERVADEQLPKIDQKDTLLALIAWCWEQKYDLTGVPKGAEELTSPDPDSAEKALLGEEEEPDESEDEPC